MPMRSERRTLNLRIMGLCGLFLAAALPVDIAPLFADEDWPMWRYDAQRSAASPNKLPAELNLLWKRTFSPRMQAWDDPLNLDLMTYDRSFEPVVKDARLFLGFNDQDKLLAIDTRNGDSLWTFYAEAPIRMAPVVDGERVFVCSDDSYLYCVDARSGKVRWKFSAAPSTQKALGNRRLVSAWPARGGPVVYDDTIYFANSIWPFMGTFITALDKETGEVRWINDSTSAQYIKQPHSAPAFAGVAPQGMLVATEEFLIVPGGRSVPAVLDRRTGELRYFHLNEGGKGTGGSFVTVDEKHFFVHTRERGTRAFDLLSGDKTAFMPNEPVVLKDLLIAAEESDEHPVVRAYPANTDSNEDREAKWEIAADGTADLVVASDHLVAAGGKRITTIRLTPSQTSGTQYSGGEIVHQLQTDSDVTRVIVADNKLFAVTSAGEILAWGASLSQDNVELLANDNSQAGSDTGINASLPSELDAKPQTVDYVPQSVRPSAAKLVYQLLAIGDPQGYGYWYGECAPELVAAWAKLSPFEQLAFVDPSTDRVTQLRQQLDRLGALGKLSVHHSEPSQFLAPEYTGQTVFVSAAMAAEMSEHDLKSIYKTVRPYGGTLILLGTELTAQRQQWLESLALEKAEFTERAVGIVIQRTGALPGAADWTHQYGDVANTIKSDDSRVKLPLGILWFGGSSNMDVLPRHGHGPPQQVVGGRLFIEGMSSLSARDVYTGRVLWTRDFGDLGNFDVYYDSTYENTPLNPKYNQVHIPGANGRGTNYVVTEDRVYLVDGNRCRILDPATGEDLGEIRLPAEDSGETAEWGYIAVYEDLLLGGLGFAMYRDRYSLEFESDKELKASRQGFGAKSFDRAASRALIAFDRYSGRQLWRADANHSFWHNGIVAGGGRIYCLDRNPSQIEEAMKRRGLDFPDTYRIAALNHRTGETEWEIKDAIFGSWLGYSAKHDALLQAGAKASDRLYSEVGQGMRVYDAADGSLHWSKDELEYSGPCVLHNDLIITNANSYSESAGAFDLRTGKQWMVKNSITGKIEPWTMTRAYGCNSIIASENLLTFRSGAAGYYDLLSDSGTGNLGGFRSGCTSNLIAANGVLNAPDYTRTCSCSYQNQTSLALVPMPAVETWSVHPSVRTEFKVDTPVETLGLNFGAPGDRRDQEGNLWIEYPTVSGEDLPLSIEISSGGAFLRHSSAIEQTSYDWVYASGLKEVEQISLGLMLKAAKDDSEPVVERESKKPASQGEDSADVSQSESVEKSATAARLGIYRIELFFAMPPETDDGYSAAVEFDVALEKDGATRRVRLDRIDDSADGGSSVASCVFEEVAVAEQLKIQFVPRQGVPVVSGLRIQRVSPAAE